MANYDIIPDYAAHGPKIDGSVTKFWAKKAVALAAAKAIGWPRDSVTRCHTRFQLGWSLHWGILKPGLITHKEYAELLEQKNSGSSA